MTELTPQMVSSAPLLRAIANSTDHTPKALAAASGRIANNMTRDLAALERQGWIEREPGSPIRLTESGRQALRLVDVPPVAPAAAPPGFVALPHSDIWPDPLNPRKHFDPDALQELAESIHRDGLLENLVVKRHPEGTNIIRSGPDGREIQDPVFSIVAGERRWRAIGLLREQGRWEDSTLLYCKLVEIDEAGHRRLALIENLQRADLRPMDEARALKELIDLEGRTTAEIAEDLSRTPRWVQQRLQFLELPEDKQEALNAGELTVREARDWLQNRPKALDLPDSLWLLFLEIHHKCIRTPFGLHGQKDALCDESAKEDTRVETWSRYPKYWIGGPYPHFESGFATGQWRIYLSSDAVRQLKLKFGTEALEDSQIDATLYGVQLVVDQAAAAALQPGQYLTPWLNGNFEITPERVAEIAEAKVKSEETSRRVAEERKKAEADRQALQLQRAEAFERAKAFAAGERREPPERTIEQLTAAAGAPLPWKWRIETDGTQGIVDANGDWVDLDAYSKNDARLLELLLITLVNRATGKPVEFEEEAPPALCSNCGDQLEADAPPATEGGQRLCSLCAEDLPDSVKALATGDAHPIGADAE